LLAALPAREYQALLPHLELVPLLARTILYNPGQPISHVHFPIDGALSFLALSTRTGAIEVGMVGREGMAGLAVFLGADRSLTRCVVQVSGQAYRMTPRDFHRYVRPTGVLFPLLLRYTHFCVDQLSQAVACISRHNGEQRLCRWLLALHDRAGASSFRLTHEFLGNMLGLRRASVTGAASNLQVRGLIRYSRGRLTIRDRDGMEQTACPCYGTVQAEWDRLFG
jgi:CRP-like cAMP-binding protein